MGVSRNIVWQEFQGYKAIKTRVLGLVNHTHSPATELFKDAVMGDGLSDEGCRIGHLADILGCTLRQVNPSEPRGGGPMGFSQTVHVLTLFDLTLFKLQRY